MVNKKIRYDVTADTSGFVAGVNKMATAQNKANKGTRRQSQSMIQLAYAMDDAQYGFRGVQNNLQQLAVTAGLGGPAVIGITALLLVVQQLVSRFEAAGDGIAKIRKELVELTKVTLASDEKIIRYSTKVIQADERRIESLQKYLDTNTELDRITTAGVAIYKDLSGTKRESIKREIEGLQKAIAANKAYRIEARKRQKESEESGKDTAKATGKADGVAYAYGWLSGITSGISSAGKGSRQDIISSEIDLQSRTPYTANEGTTVIDYQALRQGFAKFKKEAEKIKEEGNELGAALQASLTSAFTGIGEAIGEALAGEGDIGEKFLTLLGNFMKQFGAALIAVGVSEIALQSGNPALMIAGGVALVAAGSALSSAQANKPTLSGGSSASSLSAASVSPRSLQGSGSMGRNVGGYSTRDGDIIPSKAIRQSMQASDRKYQALYG